MGKANDGGMAAAVAKANQLAAEAKEQYRDMEQYLADPDELLYSGMVAPELVLASEDERIRESRLADIELDPRLQQAQETLLADLEQRSREGFSAEDRARMEAMRRQVAGDEQARQQSILAQMARRGALDSGAQLAAQLSSSQAATDRAAQQAQQFAAQSAQARRDALSQAANTAAQMQQASYGRQADLGRARDQIAAFNAAVAQRDTGARQQQQRDISNVKNIQEQQRVVAAQQPFEQRMRIADARAGALSRGAQTAMQGASMARPQASGLSRALGAVGGLASTAASLKTAGLFADGGIGGFDDYDMGGMPREAAIERYNREQAIEGKRLAEERRRKESEQYELPKQAEQAVERLMEREPAGVEEGQLGMAGMPVEAERERMERLRDMEAERMREQEEDVREQQKLAEASMKKPEMDLGKVSEALGGLQELTGSVPQAPSSRIAGPAPEMPAKMKGGIIDPVAAPQFKDGGMKDSKEMLLDELDRYSNKGMNFEAGGMGSIIDSGMDSFTGDDLPDRINDGEMVLNLDQQDRLEDLLKELAERRRADEMVDNGEAEVNRMQQDTLMDIARGEALPEDLDQESNIVEEIPVMEEVTIEPMMEEGTEYQDGGIEEMLGLDQLDQMINPQGMSPDVIPYRDEESKRIAEEMMMQESMKAQEQPALQEMVKDKVQEETNDIVERQNAPKEEPKMPTPPKQERVVDRYNELLEELEGGKGFAAVADVLSTLSNIANQQEFPEAVGRVILPVNALKDLEKRRDKILQAKTEDERARAQEDYKNRYLKYLQEQDQNRMQLSQERLARSQSERELGRERKEKDQLRRFSKDIYGVRKDFMGDPVVKELRKQDISFDQAEGLLEAMENNNRVAIGALGTKMARAMGEVGVLTDADVVRYIQRNDVSGQVQDFFSRKFEGKVSDMTQKDLEDITNIMKLGANKRIKRLREDYVTAAYENFGKQYGITREEVERRLGARSLGTAKQNNEENKIEGTVKIRRKSDGMIKTLPQEKAQSYLKDDRFEEVK